MRGGASTTDVLRANPVGMPSASVATHDCDQHSATTHAGERHLYSCQEDSGRLEQDEVHPTAVGARHVSDGRPTDCATRHKTGIGQTREHNFLLQPRVSRVTQTVWATACEVVQAVIPRSDPIPSRVTAHRAREQGRVNQDKR